MQIRIRTSAWSAATSRCSRERWAARPATSRSAFSRSTTGNNRCDMTVTLICDITVAILLIATIGYAAVLNRRLGALREDRTKLEELIQGLNVASINAQSGIAGLRKATDEVGKDLEKELAASRSLRDDLHYLIERGGTIADRLESGIRTRRDE